MLNKTLVDEWGVPFYWGFTFGGNTPLIMGFGFYLDPGSTHSLEGKATLPKRLVPLTAALCLGSNVSLFQPGQNGTLPYPALRCEVLKGENGRVSRSTSNSVRTGEQRKICSNTFRLGFGA